MYSLSFPRSRWRTSSRKLGALSARCCGSADIDRGDSEPPPAVMDGSNRRGSLPGNTARLLPSICTSRISIAMFDMASELHAGSELHHAIGGNIEVHRGASLVALERSGPRWPV